MKQSLIAFVITAIVFISCDRDDYDKIVKDTTIKTEHAAKPPVADEITLQQLSKGNKWGNFRMTANLRGQLTDSYLAYEVDGEKIVLRDDGKGADSVKGDGIYSVYLNMDANEVRSMVKEQNESVTRANRFEQQNQEITRLLRFQKGDTTNAKTLHNILQGDPNFKFVNRQVVFDKKNIPFVDVETALRDGIPIRIFPGFLCPPPPPDLVPKSLMITDLAVVEDATRTWNPAAHTGNRTGAWTFNNIINQMVNKALTGKTATEFVLNWLQSWAADIPLNGDVATARTNINTLITNWKKRSATLGLPADTLDMAEAPFKLLAIVNRVDLRTNTGYGGGNAGEGRFVFAVMSSTVTAVSSFPMSFTVIFEYGVNKSGCKAVQNWGQQWYNLHTKTPGDPAYNSELQAITDQFVNANTNTSKPNGCSLNQIRTDEIAIGSPWELREFNIDGTTNLLKLVTVKMNPRNSPGNSLNNTALLASFINANCVDILANNYQVPETFSGQPFLGARSINQNGPSDVWNAPGLTCTDNVLARRIFSLNTCNSCHGGETQTGFTHVNVASFGSTAGLSGFLTGETINDPVSGTPVTFSDLDDRAVKLQNLVCMMCRKFGPVIFRPNRMVH